MPEGGRSKSSHASGIWNTPPKAGFFLAVRLAALASVLVAPMPTETGSPVHLRTLSLTLRPCAAGSAKPVKSRNDSSML